MGYYQLGATAQAKTQKRQDDFVADANKALAKGLSIILKAGTVLPLSSKQKNTLVNQPLNFLLDLFDPVKDFYKDIIGRVLERTGKLNRTIPILGVKMRMSPFKDADEKRMAKNHPEMYEFYDSLRTIGQVIMMQLTCLPIMTDEIARKLTKQPVYKGIEFIPFSDIGAIQPMRGSMYAPTYEGLGAAGVDDAAILGTVAALAPAIAPIIVALLQVLGPMMLKPPDVTDLTLPAAPPPAQTPPPATQGQQLQEAATSPFVLLGVAAVIGALFLSKQKKAKA